MNIIIIMMNIKNIFITTSISVLFGVYSIYNMLEYINNIEVYYSNKLEELQIRLDESNIKYENIDLKYKRVNKELLDLYNRVKELEEKNEVIDTIFNSNNNFDNFDNTYVSDNNLLKDQPICDAQCDFQSALPKLRKETMSSIDILHSIFEIEQKQNEFLDMSCVEVVNDINKNSLILTPCSSRRNSFSNTEKAPVSSRQRSISVTDLNWAGLTKKFLFG